MTGKGRRQVDYRDDRLDRVLSSVAAVAVFLFFFAAVAMGWYQAFRVIAG